MKLCRLLTFTALLLLSCSKNSNEVRDTAEKFVQYVQFKYKQAGGADTQAFKALDYNIPTTANDECIVTVTMQDLQIKGGNQIGSLYIKLKQYENKGWAVIEYDIRTDNKLPNWNAVPVPLNGADLDKLINSHNKADNTIPSAINNQETGENNRNENTSEREAILNALRRPVEGDLQQQVKFAVANMQRSNGWVFVKAKPIKPDGSPIDYTTTKFQPLIDDGMFDEGILALLQFRNGNWQVIEYEIGATDYPGQTWIEKHTLQSFGKKLGLTN